MDGSVTEKCNKENGKQNFFSPPKNGFAYFYAHTSRMLKIQE